MLNGCSRWRTPGRGMRAGRWLSVRVIASHRNCVLTSSGRGLYRITGRWWGWAAGNVVTVGQWVGMMRIYLGRRLGTDTTTAAYLVLTRRVEAMPWQRSRSVQTGEGRHLKFGHVFQSGDVTQLLIVWINYKPCEHIHNCEQKPYDEHCLMVSEVQVLTYHQN